MTAIAIAPFMVRQMLSGDLFSTSKVRGVSPSRVTYTASSPRDLRVLADEDGYEITAIPLVACALQLLDGSIRRPGLHTMGSAVDPQRLLDDMRRLGLQVSGL
jgi:hypothetical protein